MKPIFAAFAAVVFLALPAAAQDNPPPSLEANGEGIEYAVPDIAIVTIGVTTRGETASAALTQNSTDLAKVIATVTGEGVAEKDIGTSGFSIYPVYEQLPDRPAPGQLPKIVGYQVQNEVRVTIRDIAKSGGILDRVVTAGANQVNGISFDCADRKTPADAALKGAIADAKRKAEIMAAAAGVKLVRILSVSASEGGGPQPVFARMELKASADVPVMPGQQQITANATVRWEIAPE